MVQGAKFLFSYLIQHPDEIEANKNNEHPAALAEISQARIESPGFDESLSQPHGSPGDQNQGAMA